MPDTDAVRLDAAGEAWLRSRHVPEPWNTFRPVRFCHTDSQDWPCPTITALDELARLRERLAAADAVVQAARIVDDEGEYDRELNRYLIHMDAIRALRAALAATPPQTGGEA